MSFLFVCFCLRFFLLFFFNLLAHCIHIFLVNVVLSNLVTASHVDMLITDVLAFSGNADLFLKMFCFWSSVTWNKTNDMFKQNKRNPRSWTVLAETMDLCQTERPQHCVCFLLILFLGAIFALTVFVGLLFLLGCAFPGPMQTSGTYNLKRPRLYHLNHCLTLDF